MLGLSEGLGAGKGGTRIGRDALLAFLKCLASDCFPHWAPGTQRCCWLQGILNQCCLHGLSCGTDCTWGRRAASVNGQSEQAAGQEKYWSAGHLPLLPHLQPGWCQHQDTASPWHRACRGLLTPSLQPAGQASSAQCVPEIILHGKGRAGGAELQPGQAAVAPGQ